MASEEAEPSRKRSRSASPPNAIDSSASAGTDGSPSHKKPALAQASAPSQNGAASTANPAPTPTAPVSVAAVDEESAFNALDEESLLANSIPSASTSQPGSAKKKDNRHVWQGGKAKQTPGRKERKEKEREAGHPYKKDWQLRSQEKAEEGEEGKEGRLPKYRTAVLLGYCGKGYSGMQIQFGGEKTIEGDLFDALAKAGAISSDNAVDSRKVDMQRAARTDAGVHAAGNVISLKLILHPPIPPEFPNLTAYVNHFLPPQIRMWGLVRAIKSFQARTSCDSRKYEYLLPSYCLLPPGKDDQLAKNLDASSPGWRNGLGEAADFADAAVLDADEGGTAGENGTGEKKTGAGRGEYERRRGWRIDEGTMKRFRALVEKFLGTRNFHNYTVGKPFNDRSVKRYMITIDVLDPQVYGDIEWVSVQIHGQSFMLHQIRKMMSMAMLACRTNTPPSLIPETFGPKCIHIPKAPPLGLLLEAPQFRTYNELKLKSVGGPEDREHIDFTKYADEIHAFKVKYIYEALRQEELETNVFHKWIRQVDCTPGNAFSFLNTKGIIPADAEVKNQKSDKAGGAGTDGVAKTSAEETSDAAKPTVKVEVKDELESDDEGVDQDQLKRGELEG